MLKIMISTSKRGGEHPFTGRNTQQLCKRLHQVDTCFHSVLIKQFLNLPQTISECRNLCLQATLYQCRSATYDSNAKVCRMTEETRRSAPSDFRPADRGVDYIENECADGN